MANNYFSKWTGKQVDDAVENAANAITSDSIVQVQGNSPSKIMSQGAVTAALSNVPSAQDISNAVDTHNADTQAHPYIQGLITAKPDVTNSRSSSQTETYSANYVNNNFVPLSFASRLYFSKTSSSTADLVDTQPTLDNANTLVVTSTNTSFDWTTPTIVITRTLGNAIQLNNTNSFAVDLYFDLSKNATLTFGAKIKVSIDSGSTWTYLSSAQSFGDKNYNSGFNTEDIVVYSDLATNEEYPIGSLIAIELFKKQDSSSSLTTTYYCGVLVDGASVFSFAEFNFGNVNINTNQIEDGAVTLQKLSTDLQNEVNDIQNKADKTQIGLITLTAANWQTSPSDIYSYTYTLAGTPTNVCVANWQSNDSADLQDVLDNAQAINDANIYNVMQNGNTLVFYAESLPTVDLKVQVEVFD